MEGLISLKKWLLPPKFLEAPTSPARFPLEVYINISHTFSVVDENDMWLFDGMNKKQDEKYIYSGGTLKKCIKKVKMNKTDSRSDENYRWPSVYPPALLIFLFN